MIRVLRRYIVPAGLICIGLIGLWSAWTIFGMRVVYSDIPVGLILTVLSSGAALYGLILAFYLIIQRRAFLTINPFAILAAYLTIPTVLFVAAVCIASFIVRSSVNTLTF